MRIAIIDDEALWRDRAYEIVKQYYREVDIKIDVFKSGIDYLENEQKYDITFVDVEMPKLDGFDTISKSRANGNESIFSILTTHTELSRKGYLVNAFRYIDKTNIDDEIFEALESSANILAKNKHITINIIGEGKKNIILKNIEYIETEKHCTLIYTKQGLLRSNYTMTQFENLLDKQLFYRCHNSFIINIDEIESYEGAVIYMKNGKEVYISRRNITEFSNIYFERKFNLASR